MADLLDLRGQLDEIDEQIVDLYTRRMKIADQVGEFKIKNGRKVFDKQREFEKLKAVSEKAEDPFLGKGIRELFSHLMAMSRKRQYNMLVKAGALGRLPFIELPSIDKENVRVVFQGTEGAYSQAAMRQYFGAEVNNFHVKTFRDAFEAIEEGAADYAVLPIENSTAGTVNEIYDLLMEFENYIVGETVLKISHTLCALPEASLDTIERVYSKAEALMQVTGFLEAYPTWAQISVANTAAAAAKIFEDGDIRKAAVCSKYAAEAYGLKILAEDINDEKDNSTRFIVITNQKVFTKEAKKVSLCFEVPHETGALFHILSHFMYNDINMSSISSRPVADKSWEYCFFVELEGNLADPGMKNALRGLREESKNLKILGNY